MARVQTLPDSARSSKKSSRPRDAVSCAVEVAQIATKQKADPFAPESEETILLEVLKEEGKKGQNST